MTDKIRELKCSNCGGELIYDEASYVGVCKFCNCSFVYEGIDERSSTKLLQNAELYFTKFKDIPCAKKYFEEAKELAPENFRTWWGLLRVCTDNLCNLDISLNTIGEIKEYIKRAISVSPGSIRSYLIEKSKEYIKKSIERRVKLLNSIDSDIEEKNAEWHSLNSDNSSLYKNIKILKEAQQCRDSLEQSLIKGEDDLSHLEHKYERKKVDLDIATGCVMMWIIVAFIICCLIKNFTLLLILIAIFIIMKIASSNMDKNRKESINRWNANKQKKIEKIEKCDSDISGFNKEIAKQKNNIYAIEQDLSYLRNQRTMLNKEMSELNIILKDFN
ncbi:MAG: hypothetical protein ACI4II_06985 [Acutalibacteraceae bacterium]